MSKGTYQQHVDAFSKGRDVAFELKPHTEARKRTLRARTRTAAANKRIEAEIAKKYGGAK